MPLATMSIRVEEETKREIEAFCADVGMNPSTAVNLFFRAVLRENRLPFEISRDPFYSAANMKIACGGSWMVKESLIGARSFGEVARLTREAVALAAKA